ncbi:MAG: hypothetical protein HY872_16315 [Chloroflexi bacterium]|nr:hypothetical protein [Chloroflexota bacterium]MBI5293441.1 hypothetical protein [Chloroflexota bacterium]
MMNELHCPQCRTPLNHGARYCSGCGVDVAVVTLLLEHASTGLEPATPYVADILVPRLGEFLVRRGFLTEEQLQTALAHQRQNTEQGQQQMFGQSLLELKLISREQLDNAIMAQVLELQAALQTSNRQLEKRVADRTAELERALAKVNEVNQLKTDFVSNISHELRTPLAQIKGYVLLLNDGTLGDLDPDQTTAVAASAAAIERLERLIEDLIRFASAARDELIVTVGDFCLSDLVPSTLTRSAPKAIKSNISLESRLPNEPVFARGDSEKLSWVLFQLVDNAIKFTPNGGHVTVSVTPMPERAAVAVSVTDTGIGIPADRTSELFQPFHQLDGSATRRYGGTGLGLALIEQIIRAHKTEIKVQSQVGRGSTFSFDLPLGHS